MLAGPHFLVRNHGAEACAARGDQCRAGELRAREVDNDDMAAARKVVRHRLDRGKRVAEERLAAREVELPKRQLLVPLVVQHRCELPRVLFHTRTFQICLRK